MQGKQQMCHSMNSMLLNSEETKKLLVEGANSNSVWVLTGEFQCH